MFSHATPLELKDDSGSRHTRLTSVVWDAQAREVLYLSNEAGPTGLWRLDPATGDRSSLTDPHLNLTRFWLVGDPTVRLVFACDPDCTEHEQLFILTHAGVQRPWIEVADSYHYFGGQLFDGVGYYVSNTASDTRHRIMRADTSSGETRELASIDAALTTVLALSPERLLLMEERTNIDRRFCLYETTTRSLMPIALGYGRIGQVRALSENTILFSGDLGGERMGLHTLNLDREEVVTIFGRSDQDVKDFSLHSETGRLSIVLSKDCASEVVTTTLNGEKVSDLLPAPVHVDAMCFMGDGDLITVTSAPCSPPAVHVHRLAEEPGASALPYGETENRQDTLECFTSFDGRQIEFVFIGRPDNRQAVIYLHGGPESMFERSHSPILEHLAESGVAVVAPNIRGSEGYGRRFIALDDGAKRTDALADVIALREYVRARYGFGDDKIGIMGHSYGGFMTLMAITHHPDLWSCAVDIAGMSHLRTFLKNAPAWRRGLRAMEYGDAATHADIFDRFAPINKAGDIRCPLLILHGDSDTRVPTAESSAMAKALTAHGKTFQLRWIEGEGHFLTKRASTEFAANAIVDFITGRRQTPAATGGTPAQPYSKPGAT